MEKCGKTIGGIVGLIVILIISVIGVVYFGSTWINIFNVLMFLAVVGMLSMLIADEVYDEDEMQEKINLVTSLWIAINGFITIPQIVRYSKETGGQMYGWGGWYVFQMVVISLVIISLIVENVVYDNELFPESAVGKLKNNLAIK